MRGAERGFFLLASCLGDPERKPLTTAQLRTLADRAWQMDVSTPGRDLAVPDLLALGYSREMAGRILALLRQEAELDHYLQTGARCGCRPLTRISAGYPGELRKRLGLDSPGVLWCKGNLSLLAQPKLALVGSREIRPANSQFAAEVGRQAARQGYVLVSGNARGADRIAQEACLAAGGSVIVVVADELMKQPETSRVLYLSEEDFDLIFTAQRALSRNRVIHALGEKTIVAQSEYEKGGTWDGTVKNLRFGWSSVFCFRDGSASAEQLCRMGATEISLEALQDLSGLQADAAGFFDE